jgi:hypothetical protein
MPSKLDQLIEAVPLGEVATKALNESAEEVGLVDLYTKGLDALDAYTKLMEALRNLDEEIAIVIRQERAL